MPSLPRLDEVLGLPAPAERAGVVDVVMLDVALDRRDALVKRVEDRVVISPNTLVVAEEFGEWEDSNRSIDLLCIDKDANLVVIELKRTEDGGHMELQAVRYAAMISTLTFDRLIEIYDDYLQKNDIELDATDSVLNFLGWREPDEEPFGQEVRIVLASADFSKEVTTSVMWLNDFDIDIRCVRMRPYVNGGQVLLDIQTVIPLPEIADHQVRIREKRQRERESSKAARDRTRYDVDVAGERFPAQYKRNMMFQIISGILKNGGTPDQVMEAVPGSGRRLFEIRDGELTADEACQEIRKHDSGGKLPRINRYFHDEGQFFFCDGKTYVLSNQWGRQTLDTVSSLAEAFPDLEIRIAPSA